MDAPLVGFGRCGVEVTIDRSRPAVAAMASTTSDATSAGYGLGRLWVEALRIDDATRIAGVRVNIWVSLVAIAAAAVSFVVLRRTRARGDHAAV